MRLVAFLTGAWVAIAALGVWFVLTGRSLWPARRPGRRITVQPRRVVRALVGLGVVGVVTRWPVAALAAAAAGWWWPELWTGRRAAQVTVERTDALASWLESIRDALRGSKALDSAILDVDAPLPIRTEVDTLKRRLRERASSTASSVVTTSATDIVNALTRFANDVNHPQADLVAAAFALHYRGASGGPVSPLLDNLADTVRAEARMHRRIDAERRRSLTVERLILGSLLTFAVLLAVTNRSYLEPYNTLSGQVVLGVCLALVTVAMVWLRRLAQYYIPRRWLLATPEVAS